MRDDKDWVEFLRLVELEKQKQTGELRIQGLKIDDLAPLIDIINLQKLEFWGNEVNDLASLKHLTILQKLKFYGTKVSNLECLKPLYKLQELDCRNNHIIDLSPLKELINLQALDCCLNRISDLSPLKELAKLQTLYCGDTQISDLSPLKDLVKLHTLDCEHTKVSDLGPLKGLTNLKSLNCKDTYVKDLKPIKDLNKLEFFDCTRTQISDLSPLNKLSNLQSLICTRTQVSDLNSLESHINLRILNLNYTRVSNLNPLKALTNLQALYCYNIQDTNIPSEMLSLDKNDNCLPRLRAYWAEKAFEAFDRAKIIILGNGQVGKTQLARYLNTQSFDPSIKTTHGIQILRPQVDVTGSDFPKNALEASLWDFGGQDIYHGTHGLFLKSQAVFVICWSPTQEDNETQELNGLIHQIHPVDYWLSYVRAMAGDDAPVIIVQTHCDVRPMDGDRMNRFNTTGLKWVKKIGFGAQKRKGGETLRQAIGDAAAHLKGQNDPQLGSSWVRVVKALETAQDKRKKSMTLDDFQALCDENGVLAEAKFVLDYCHNIGVVFYRKGFFDDQIILDQQWALGAIYAVLERGGPYQQIVDQNGRLSRSDLTEVWKGYSAKEQDLFLGMMQSCGIIFKLYDDQSPWKETENTVYIVPELLPVHRELRPELGWVEGAETVEARFNYPLLHKGVMRELMSQIGQKAGLFGNYWKDGVQFHDRHTGASAVIEAHYGDNYAGDIIIRCQGSKELLDHVIDFVRKANERLGIDNTAPNTNHSPRADFNERSKSTLEYGQTKASEQQDAWYVSYAWGDRDGATEDERKREVLVDKLCDEAEKRGRLILRDKAHLKAGECFERFKDTIAQGKRIFIIISQKYLVSYHCIGELVEIWLHKNRDQEQFRKSTHIFMFDNVEFTETIHLAKYRRTWRTKAESLQQLAIEYGPDGYEIQRDADFYNYAIPLIERIFPVIKTAIRENQWDRFIESAFAGD